MEKHKIIVPKDIRYVGQKDPKTNERIWLDYDLNLYDFPHILNKKLTGCGYTEYCLKNEQYLILISPRKFLLENKEDQHQGEVYYVRNEVENQINFEKDLSIDKISKNNGNILLSKLGLISDDDKKARIMKLKQGILDYYYSCQPSKKNTTSTCLTLFGWPLMSCLNAKLVFDYDYNNLTVDTETTWEGINYG
jgi:hypothetical protein